MIKDIHGALLTTVAGDGDPRSRPMITALQEFDGDRPIRLDQKGQP